MHKPANRNALWAWILVDELARAGLRAVCIAPGSRSTPLAFAFEDHPEVSVTVHPDERGAAFFALGLALATGSPAATLCTSGTAAANLFPAVVEASQSRVPLLLLTADRPQELRDSGSNQTIDQVKLYGGYVRWSVDVAPPEPAPSEVMIDYLRSLACRALARAAGFPPGPVHLNLPFRKPLEPQPTPGDVPDSTWTALTDPVRSRIASQPYVAFIQGRLAPTAKQVDDLATLIHHSQRALIYCGPRCPRDDFPDQVMRLAKVTGFPIFADPLSGLRFHHTLHDAGELVMGGYETFLKSIPLRSLDPPDLVLQFGAVPTSHALAEYLDGLSQTRRIQFDQYGDWSDDTYKTTDYWLADPVLVCAALSERLASAGFTSAASAWKSVLARSEQQVWQVIEQARRETFFEGIILADVLDELHSGDGLFVASSLPVRHLDQFGKPCTEDIHIYANRGASGIDGTIASALGVAASGLHKRLALVLGDVAFFHDMNSLLALKHLSSPITIIVINNDGGGIFQRLPVAAYEPPFTRLFRAPHGLQFEHAASLFGLDYACVKEQTSFRQALRSSLKTGTPRIIEVSSDVRLNERMRRDILKRLDHHSIPTPGSLTLESQ